jgi:hypothetical protein
MCVRAEQCVTVEWLYHSAHTQAIWHRRFGNARLLNNIARRVECATENTLSSERVSRRRVCLILMAVREMDRANSSGMLKFGDASITRLLSSGPGFFYYF